VLSLGRANGALRFRRGELDLSSDLAGAALMRPPKKSHAARDFIRKAREQARAPEPPAPGAARPAAAPRVHEMACICGQLLRIAELQESDDEKRCGCPVCKRRFMATFTPDPKTGAAVLCPMYIEDDTSTGDTHMAEIPGAKPGRPSSKGQFDDDLEPQPPPQLSFACSCGKKLGVKKEVYDKRVRCPHCHIRMLINVIYDPAAKRFGIYPVRLNDAPSGDTWMMEKS